MIPIIIQTSNVKESIKDRNMRFINGVPQIVFLVKRVKDRFGSNIIIATSNETEDDELVDILKSLKVNIYRGKYDDILLRLLEAAHLYQVNHFVRIYGNYPLTDLDALESLYQEHVAGGYDYSYNEHRNGVLWGTGCDVFNLETLEKLNKELKDYNQREMVSFYLQQNTKKYKIYVKQVIQNRPGYKLNYETEKDLKVIQEIVNNVPEISNSQLVSYLNEHEVIASYNTEVPAKEVGIEKMFFHNSKVQDILSNKENANTYPISVELTLTNRCNLSCVYCSDQDLRIRQGKDANLNYELLCKLFEDLSSGGTKGVVFEGGGEPTLHPDFEKLIQCAKEYNLAVGLITNGTVFLSEKVLKQFEWIRVSLDASNAEEFFMLKKVDLFEKVLSNIAHYALYCETVGVGYVVTNNNMKNIETLIMRLRETGASYIQLRPVVDAPQLSPSERKLKYLEAYRSQKFNVIVDGMQENMDAGNSNLPCIASSLTSVISGNGNVYLCGRLNIYDWIEPIGNIKEQSFSEIWKGDIRKKQLSMIGNPEFCSKNCPQCRISKFNSLFNRLLQTKSVHFI